MSCQDIDDGSGAAAFLQKRHEELRTKRDKPQPVLRVNIPKADAGKRPLGSSPWKKSRDRQKAKDDPM